MPFLATRIPHNEVIDRIIRTDDESEDFVKWADVLDTKGTAMSDTTATPEETPAVEIPKPDDFQGDPGKTDIPDAKEDSVPLPNAGPADDSGSADAQV